MSSDNRVRIEFVVGGEVFASRLARPYQVDEAIKKYKIASQATREDWAIFMYRTSKVGHLINKINNLEYRSLNKKPPRLKRSFDIFELHRLREAGNGWRKIATQLYSNERAVREYYRDNKYKLHATTDNLSS